MRQTIRLSVAAVALLGMSLLPHSAMAKKADHGNKFHKEKSEIVRQEHGDKNNEGNVNISLHFNDDAQTVIRSYMRDSHRTNCPPGLAKKNNNCLPPGQAKKYRIGGNAPSDYQDVPAELLHRLSPPPAGAFYAMVDKDVLLIAEAGHKVLDAVTLLSALD